MEEDEIIHMHCLISGQLKYMTFILSGLNVYT